MEKVPETLLSFQKQTPPKLHHKLLPAEHREVKGERSNSQGAWYITFCRSKTGNHLQKETLMLDRIWLCRWIMSYRYLLSLCESCWGDKILIKQSCFGRTVALICLELTFFLPFMFILLVTWFTLLSKLHCLWNNTRLFNTTSFWLVQRWSQTGFVRICNLR